MADSPRVRRVKRKTAWRKRERLAIGKEMLAVARDRMLTATKGLQMGLADVDVLVYEITEYQRARRWR